MEYLGRAKQQTLYQTKQSLARSHGTDFAIDSPRQLQRFAQASRDGLRLCLLKVVQLRNWSSFAVEGWKRVRHVIDTPGRRLLV